jgi:hypothetical protein
MDKVMNSNGKALSIFVKIALSSAVIAALITSLFSYLAMRETNMQLIRLEEMRVSSDINAFRYTKIYSALEEIQNLPSIDYTYLKEVDGELVQDEEMLKKVVGKASDRYYNIHNLYLKVKPLINTTLLMDLETKLLEEKRQSEMLIEWLYNRRPNHHEIDVMKLLELRRNIEEMLKEVLVSQVTVLTNQTQHPVIPLKHAVVTGNGRDGVKESNVFKQEKTIKTNKPTANKPLNTQNGDVANQNTNTTEVDYQKSFVTKLTVWSEIDAYISVNGTHKIRIDHRSGFDYSGAKVRVSPNSVMTLEASGFKKTVSLWSLCDENSTECKVHVGIGHYNDIQISEEEKRTAMGGPSDIPTLVKELKEEVKYSARAWAAERLGYIGGKNATESLLQALNDPEPYVQGMSAEALGRIGDPSVLPKLEEAYASYNKEHDYGIYFEAAIRDLKFIAERK